jgi:4,5-dihydroxyphthalate decarboxylase
MSKLRLSVAVGNYDRVRPLMDGAVQIDGVDPVFMNLPPEEIFFRAFRNVDFDICELSMSSFTVKTAEHNCPYVGVPAFVSRAFRHNSIYVRRDRVKAPADLKGKRVGLPEYQLTACVWARIILEDDHGVRPSDIVWVRGGIEHPGRPEKIAIALPADVRMEDAPPDVTISQLLERGEIDGFIAPRVPSLAGKSHPHIGWLFPDPVAAGRDYFKRTGIFPIMHSVALRQNVWDEHPWIARSLFKAFQRAKEDAYARLKDLSPYKISLAWFRGPVEEQERILGKDPWPYGLEKNRHVVETLAGYLYEQGLADKRMPVEELFAPNTLEL